MPLRAAKWEKSFVHIGGGVYAPNARLMKVAAKIILDAVKKEAALDMAKVGAVSKSQGKPVSLPRTSEFLDSFSYKIERNEVEVLSSWPMFEQHIEGRGPYPMTWLTQAEGVTVVPMITSTGITIMRMAPLDRGSAWIHPGFLRYTFLQRGLDKGTDKAISWLLEEAGGDFVCMTLEK